MLFNVAVAVVARRKARRTGRAVKLVRSDTDIFAKFFRGKVWQKLSSPWQNLTALSV